MAQGLLKEKSKTGILNYEFLSFVSPQLYQIYQKAGYSQIVEFVFNIQKVFIMDISVQNMAKCKYDTNVWIHSI